MFMHFVLVGIIKTVLKLVQLVSSYLFIEILKSRYASTNYTCGKFVSVIL